MKFIFLVTDAPPHGEEFTVNMPDHSPDGCPCEKNLEDQIY